MECLACGWCCHALCPITVEGEPCPHLAMDEIATCSIYDRRPQQCRDHGHAGYRYCPIGIDVLGYAYPDQVARRIDAIWEYRKTGGT